MALEDIEKLRLKVEKDPASRLFLPLAEEYRKSGMLDEAIAALLRGLERHPGYTSARVALGRIYIEKDMLQDARAEFERVISVVPDNLFAHKKLADIYRDLGETDKAVAEYRTVLTLNPLDEEAMACLDSIGGGPEVERRSSFSPEEAGGEGPRGIFLEPGEEETLEEAASETPGAGEATISEADEPAVQAVEEEFDAFDKTFSGEGAEASDAEQFVLMEEEAVEFSGMPAGEETKETFQDRVGEEIPLEAEMQAVLGEFAGQDDIAAVDAFVASGDYSRALDGYKELLSRNPEDRQVRQRLVELKAYLKLTGRGEEILIGRLDAFLEAIKNRFSGNPRFL